MSKFKQMDLYVNGHVKVLKVQVNWHVKVQGTFI